MSAEQLRVLVAGEATGSQWQYSIDLARGLDRLGVQTVLALIGPSPTSAQREAADSVNGLTLVDTGIPLEWLTQAEGTARRAGAAMADVANLHGVDLVQLNTPALAAGGAFHMPTVALQHRCIATWWQAVHETPLPPELAWRAEMVRAGLHACDIVVTPTTAFAETTRDCYGLADLPRTVYCGRSPLTVPRGAPHDFVFTAGRLWDEGKNLGTIDAAAARLSVPIRAAGPVEGPSGAAVMFDNIHCLGALDEAEMGRWLAAKPVFVSAALYEPFGLAALEAAAAGCALILSDIPAFRELWEDVALFVPPRDEDALLRAIAAIVGDDFERAVMGRAAQERALRFTPDVMAAQMAAIYRSLLPAVTKPVLAARMAA